MSHKITYIITNIHSIAITNEYILRLIIAWSAYVFQDRIIIVVLTK